MPLRAAGLRFPHKRVLLARTKLAYIHLRNLLTDAKRDRSARVFAYAVIWLPDELLLLYLEQGELVNAVALNDQGYRVIAIAGALDQVPSAAEFGEICFHEAADEQLACMHFSQATEPDPWPNELDATDPTALLRYLRAITFDGMLEVIRDEAVSYAIVQDGLIERAYVAGHSVGAPADRVRRLISREGAESADVSVRVSRWPAPPPLPVQAAPALIHAYRGVASGLVARLTAAGNQDAAKIAEAARHTLVAEHRCLAKFSVLDPPQDDPVVGTDALTEAMAAWISEIIWSAAPAGSTTAEDLLRDATRERRHMLQSAGFYNRLPWALA
jgi:hypothetical protein